MLKHPNYSRIISKYHRELFMDKCNWLITYIFNSKVREENKKINYFNIHSKLLKKFIGNNYLRVIETLVDLNVIDYNEKYSSAKYTKSFALKHKVFSDSFKVVTVTSKVFRNKLKEYATAQAKEAESNPVLSKINHNTIKIQLTNNPASYLTDFKLHSKDLSQGMLVWYDEKDKQRLSRYDAFFDAFRVLNNTNSIEALYEEAIFFQPRINPLGRVYHIGASMPRLIRKICVTKNNELIYEVDMASAQPSLLILEWIRSLNTITNEAKKCLKLVANGGVYKYLVDHSDVLRDMDYAKMKKEILKTFNGQYKPTKLYKELKALLPEFIKWIDNIKFNEGYKKVSHRGHSAEANVFVEVYKNLPEDMFGLLIHDCILTTEDKTQLVRDKLIERVRELYKDVIPKELNIDKLFKTDKVSVVRWVDYRN